MAEGKYPLSKLPEQHDQLVVGRKAVLELIRQEDVAVAAVYVAERAVLPRELDAELDRASKKGLPVYRCLREDFRGEGEDFHDQGIAALLKPRREWSLEQVAGLGLKDGAAGVLVILENLLDPQNIGSVLRACAGFGVDGVLITKRRTAPVSAAARRVSVGASELLPIASVNNLAQALKVLKDAGYWIIGTALDPSAVSIGSADLPFPLAVIFGSEEKGLRHLTKEHCDMLVQIPMMGAVQSLNVGQAAAVVLYDLTRRLTPRNR